MRPMRSRPLLATLASLAVAGGLVVAGTSSSPATSATPATRAGSGQADPHGMRAIVTAPVGGDWSVRFVDGARTVLATVGHDAIALVTAGGRVPADRVLAVHGGT